MKEIEKYVGYYLGVYVVVLAICGFFQYFYHCQGESLMCAISIDGIGTIITTTATLLTPIVAIIGFLNWKIEKQYDLEKSQAEKLINLLNEVNFEIYNKYHLIKSLYSVKENIVIIPSLEHERVGLSQINEIKLIQQGLELLNKILNHQDRIDIKFYKKLYMQFHFFDQSITYIEQSYLDDYYRAINNEFKVNQNTQIIDLDNFGTNFENSPPIIGNAARRKLSKQLYEMITTKNIKVTITDPLSKEINESDKTFAEHRKDYDQSFNDLVQELVKIIKPHKKTA